MEGTYKSPKVVDFVEPARFAEAMSKATPHKSPKVVDFIEPGSFTEAI